MDVDDILVQVSEIVAGEIKGKYRLFLFGSRAAGVHDPKSDIDIGIISEKKMPAGCLLAIQEKIEALPTLLKIDFIDFSSVDEEFKAVAMKHIQDLKHGC